MPSNCQRETPIPDSHRAWALLGAVAALLLALAPHSEAKRIFIPKDYRSLQAGIDASSPGDTIWVGAGTYSGPLIVKKRLTIFGDAGPENTILDGGDSVRVLHIEGVNGAAVIGFTIRRGRANAGGGIHCLSDTSLMISSCTFEKNWESAVSCWKSFDINVRDTRFLENDGSAISLNFSSAIIQSCIFRKNRGYTGGAISFVHSRSTFPIRTCTFEDNRAEGATGGAVNVDSSEVIFAESEFKGNSAKVAGGGIAAMNGSRATASRCNFFENHSAASGAIHSDRSTLNVAVSLFGRNRATAFGSAVGLVERGLANINPIIQSNTFYKNASEAAGAAVWAERVSPEIRKNIFVVERDQKAVFGVGTFPLYECNLIHDPTGGATGSLPSIDTLVGDPLFCDPEEGDFYLRDISPAILATCGPVGPLPKKCTSFKLVPSK